MAIEIIILLCLILLNGFFSLSEMAIVSSRKARLRHEAEKGNKKYRLALETAEHPSWFLSTIQVVITLIGTLAGALGGATVAQGLSEVLKTFPFLTNIAGPLSVGIVVILTTFVSVVLGELVPKTMALARPESLAAAVIGPVRLIAVVFTPLARFLSATTNFLVKLLGVKSGQEPLVTEEEVRVLIAQGAETGVFEEREREMVEGVLSLGDRRVTSLMTPRTEVIVADIGNDASEIEKKIIENSRYGYLPVVDGDLDKVVGLLWIKECLKAIASRSFENPRAFIHQCVFIPETVSALRAFAVLKESGARSALILDEYGGVSGLISLSDLIESILGDIPSTGNGDEPTILRRQDGSYLVDGAMQLDRFMQELEIDLPTGDYDTVAGFLLDCLGAIPRPGDTWHMDNCIYEVLDMDGNRIDKILVSMARPSGELSSTDDDPRRTK